MLYYSIIAAAVKILSPLDDTNLILFTVDYLLMMVVAFICMYIYIYTYIGAIHSSCYSCCILSYMYIVWCIQLIIYCMVQRWERYKHIASLPLPLLLLLIGVYDDVGTYNKTIIENWYVVDDDVPVPVPILSHNDM